MKRLTDLPKKERNAIIQKSNGFQQKYGIDNAEYAYIVENNTVEEIAEFLKHQATTTIFPGTPESWIVSVYLFNRLHEYVNGDFVRIRSNGKHEPRPRPAHMAAIINTIAASNDKIISVKDAAAAAGIKRLTTQECRSIAIAVEKIRPDLRAVKLLDPDNYPYAQYRNMFDYICLVKRDLVFDAEDGTQSIAAVMYSQKEA